MAKSINPSFINPMIVACGAGVPTDTINNVSKVLEFVASAVSAADDEAVEIFCVSGASEGLALILQTCCVALKYHCDKEGGAA